MLVIDSWRERHRVKPGVTVRLLMLISFIKAISYEAQCHTGAQCNSISEFLSEARCPAGLDPASFPKKIVEKDTGSWPGVTVRLVLLISFIKTISYEAQ